METPSPHTTGPRSGARAEGNARELPPDFAKRIAQKVVFTLERERDPDEALERIAKLCLRNLAGPERARTFIDMIDVNLDNDDTARAAALTWVSIVFGREDEPAYENMVNDILDAMIFDHQQLVRPNYMMEGRRKSFSFYARNIGEVFIAMMAYKNELYEIASQIFSIMIRKEVQLENAAKEKRTGAKRITLTEREEKPKVGKKLFDDVVDYIHARGEQKTDTLNQQNPNEFIAALADRMRGTRRYVIQDIMTKQAAEKKKEAEKELSERLASAEEIILARSAFKKSLRLFWEEKRYNIKYLAVEKVRVTLHVLGIIIGILYFLAGYLGLAGISWWAGLVVFAGMFVFSRFIASRQGFHGFYPENVSRELEVVLGSMTPTLRKMSKEQMDAFMVRQVKDSENNNLLPILPEFFKYVFAIMPDRKNVIITGDEIGEVMQNLEMDIARVVRTSMRGI